MGTNQEDVLLDDLDIENGFNDAIDDLRKSLSLSSGELRKAKKDEDEGYESEDEDSEDEGEEEETYRKSIEDTLREEPEAAAAMDVEPFLLQLAKAIDESNAELVERVAQVERLTKSIGQAAVASSELQKSTREMVKQIGGMPVPSRSLKRLQKSRFDGDEKEFDTRDVLAKSREWFQKGKIDLTEAGLIEGRINKNLLGRVNDKLDGKVAALMGEE